MPETPPSLPGPATRRVLAVSLINGWSVAGFAALCALAALLNEELVAAGWGMIALSAGLMELHGHFRLKAGARGGPGWMIAAQFWLMAAIYAYAWLRWRDFEAHSFWDSLPALAQNEVTRQLTAAGLGEEEREPFLAYLNAAICLSLVLTSLVYQGGLVLFYTFKWRAVRNEIASPAAGAIFPP
jgi:hypothetical protein